ncbi:MAG: hypothetical protein A2172_01185 [Candidatus Woykebacteria bacterium RBG_13_40_15]|uniref:Uncharacterized protein n=1 Tax=Candidatus Woykebacteria bacterium RBG_13_40_15 TaxID=1802593 RepID=A0A1G1W951_9BACT|nr:MAG: hypothetical protein A2172_01185 [Candidatus Woykebacteria bacterium RBG_13_40_15]
MTGDNGHLLTISREEGRILMEMRSPGDMIRGYEFRKHPISLARALHYVLAVPECDDLAFVEEDFRGRVSVKEEEYTLTFDTLGESKGVTVKARRDDFSDVVGLLENLPRGS